MYDAPVENTAAWYVIYTKPRQEERADSNLRAWKVETFAPKIKERCVNQFTGKATFVTRHLFPRYIFARFNAAVLLHKVYFTRGVQNVVSFSNRPSPVADSIIELIKLRQEADGFIRLNSDLMPGDKVKIQVGPLQNFTGVFESRSTQEERVSILLTTVSYQARVIIEQKALRKVS
jgi:transcriptional antiterminator RfaH